VRWEPETRPLVLATRAGVGLFGRLVERAGGPQLDLVEHHPAHPDHEDWSQLD
jgi:hypothetical protein